MHLCHVKLQHSDQAIDVLQSIPGKQRNAKINMALAKLYHQSGMERSAITAYKEVLKVHKTILVCVCVCIVYTIYILLYSEISGYKLNVLFSHKYVV